jgi:Secretion system C-terminal sorting domain
MKKIKSIALFLMVACSTANVHAQANVNPNIAVLPANSGVVPVGATLDLEITVGATGSGTAAISKLRPNITVPASVTFLVNAQQTGLPSGWTILTNTGSQLRVCNSADPLAGGTSRTIILKVQGVTESAAQTFSGQMNFGNGGATCASGPAPANNNTADDFATSTIQVTAAVLPLTLVDFSATLVNCEPSLNWITESETNTDRFEIEASNVGGTDWKMIGNVAASGYSNTKTKYNFIDKNINASLSEKTLYRLKMIDKDGMFKYSNTLPVFTNCKTAKLLVYPNPVQDGRLYITLAGTTGFSDATLLSVSGQVILKTKIINGTNNINVSNIADGVYMLNIKGSNGLNKNTKVSIKN